MRIVKGISGIEGRIKCSQHIRSIAQKDKRPEMPSSHSCAASIEIIKEISDDAYMSICARAQDKADITF